MTIALDATYSLGDHLSGVGVYSREMLFGLATAHPDAGFRFCYRPHRFVRSYAERLPANASRRLLAGGPPRADLFHALNQRVDWRHRRTVSTFHDLFVLTGDYSTPEFRARFAAQARRAAESSDLIITVSEFTASQVEQLLNVERARLRVIPHGVRIRAASQSPRAKLILSVGAIQHRKNVVRLVEAFSAVGPEWRLVLAGAPSGYQAGQALAAIERSARRNDIHVAGYVSDDELRRLYARASIFAFPSLDEGFGMPVLDAMASGIAVLTSNRSALPEIAGPAALLVDPLDTSAIAAALRRLTTEEELRNDLVSRGVARAREFTWERAVNRTWSVYHELI